MRDESSRPPFDERADDAGRQVPGEDRTDRGRMYEQATQTSGYGQQGWQGGYSQPAPGQVGQQQDYRQQQLYGQGDQAGWIEDAGAPDRPDLTFGRGEGLFRGRGPKGYVRSDDRIREDVSERLTEDSWIDASDLEVTVTAGVVTLAGTLPDWDQKRRAEELATAVPGVVVVTDHVRVRGDDRDPVGRAVAGGAESSSTG